MKNRSKWVPSKFEYYDGRLRASKNPKEVNPSSRLIADSIAAFYEKTIPEYAHGKLADLGCGKVPLYATYRDHVQEIVCVDWVNTPHGNYYLDKEADLNKKLPLADQSFDTVILSDVLEHIAEPQKLYSEVSRILKNKGILLLNVPFYYWLHEEPHDYYRYTEFALRRFTENSGLKMVELAPLGGFPEILGDILSKNARNLPLIGRPLVKLIYGTTRLFIRTPYGKRVSARSGHTFPLGYGLVARKAG